MVKTRRLVQHSLVQNKVGPTSRLSEQRNTPSKNFKDITSCTGARPTHNLKGTAATMKLKLKLRMNAKMKIRGMNSGYFVMIQLRRIPVRKTTPPAGLQRLSAARRRLQRSSLARRTMITLRIQLQTKQVCGSHQRPNTGCSNMKWIKFCNYHRSLHYHRSANWHYRRSWQTFCAMMQLNWDVIMERGGLRWSMHVPD